MPSSFANWFKNQFGWIILTAGLLTAVGWNVSISSPKIDNQFIEINKRIEKQSVDTYNKIDLVIQQVKETTEAVTKVCQIVSDSKEQRILLEKRVSILEDNGSIPLKLRIEELERKLATNRENEIRAEAEFKMMYQLTISNSSKLDSLKEQVKDTNTLLLQHISKEN